MGGFPDLMTILINLSSHIAPIISMIQGVCVLIGLYLIAHALMEIWGVTYDNAMKYVAGNQKFSIGSALMQLIIGAIFLALANLEWVGIMSRTVTGDYVNSRFIANTVVGSSYSDQVEMAFRALLGVLQIVGIVAIAKGTMTVNRIFNGQTQQSLGTAMTWIVGGVLAWNFEWFGQVLQNSTGFDVAGLLMT